MVSNSRLHQQRLVAGRVAPLVAVPLVAAPSVAAPSVAEIVADLLVVAACAGEDAETCKC